MIKKRMIAAVLACVLSVSPLTNVTVNASETIGTVYDNDDTDLSEEGQAIDTIDGQTIESNFSVTELCTSVIPESTDDQDPDTESTSVITEVYGYINPLYSDVISESDLPELTREDILASVSEDAVKEEALQPFSTEKTTTKGETHEYCESIEEAGALLREALTARESTIVIYYYGEPYTQEYFSNLCREQLIPEALKETDNPTQGDYLHYTYGGVSYGAVIGNDSENPDAGNCLYAITFTPKYYTTLEQETYVSEIIENLLTAELQSEEGEPVYETIYRIYDYICSTVNYDYANLNDSSYTLKYTAYAALVNHSAVCQGYALLVYRMLRELGFGVRMVKGYGGAPSTDETASYTSNHAWNIIKIENGWYLADATWDAKHSGPVAEGTYSYQYFLRGTTDFDQVEEPYSSAAIHVLQMSDDFFAAYPIEESRYKYGSETTDDPSDPDNPTDPDQHVHSYGDWQADYPASIYRLCTEGDASIEISNPFTDLKNNAFFIPILWAVDQGITGGRTATTFAPDEACTRQQAVMFLWSAAGKPEPKTTKNPFTDVKSSGVFYKAIMWAVENGITSGKTAKTFAPNATCTRQQIAMFLWKYKENPAHSVKVNPFTDISQNGTFYNPIMWAVEKGITSGKTATTFAPNAECTRAQIVTFLYRLEHTD